MKLGTTTHPKFRRLMMRLDLKQFEAAGLLEMLWAMAAQFTDDGDLSRFDCEDICAYVDWRGDAKLLIDTLVDCRWLDRDGDSVAVHDWQDHMPHFVTERLKKREQRAASRLQSPAKTKDVPRQYQDSTGNSANSLGKSDLAQSSPVQPSPVSSPTCVDEVRTVIQGKALTELPTVTPEEVFVTWNASGALNKPRDLTPERRKNLMTRLKDQKWPWREAIERLPIPNDAKFKFQPTFDWLIANAGNARKVVEGNYDRHDSGNGLQTENESDRLAALIASSRRAR